MATEPSPGGPVAGYVRRYNRKTRWFHAVSYTILVVLFGTGWWLTLGNEGRPSILARVSGVPDTRIHTLTGWVSAAAAVVGLLAGRRALRTFLAESVRTDPGDLEWFRRWPVAVLTGRFPHHRGHFDPGQRLFNLAIAGCLLVVIVSGVGLAWLSGGSLFTILVRVHRWGTYVGTALILGHVTIASGILPGYRGAWKSMHLGGRLPVQVARRLWPSWTSSSLRGNQSGEGRRSARPRER
ncbi:cytochrome b/b6 domain-containing protein [Actinopolymorpha singaporensis]|uniref:Formate dehydrogenase subunit gamma n=1 Tax=Actinopolymorpha singaporensis TaxID=117157 RepID=A0A1H1R748_9ACTN|nr:cytochrome b/b6 domain-containing protein [Actinopolymorpha singaporensis]SDS31588.1 formate dehydrogenase subunit gamma [Actinopolymorpha singaporensis]